LAEDEFAPEFARKGKSKMKRDRQRNRLTRNNPTSLRSSGPFAPASLLAKLPRSVRTLLRLLRNEALSPMTILRNNTPALGWTHASDYRRAHRNLISHAQLRARARA
jgi:hypothetical protein